MMMRRRKHEAKVMSPMFPRLHVNDTEKGGPKAPPRNKMALYEQLSIPSQRFNSALPLPPNNTNSLVPSISSSHGEGNESSMFMPFENSHEPSSLAEKFHSYSIHGAKISSTKENQNNQFPKATDYHSLDTTPSTTAVCKSTFLSPHFSNFKKFSPRKLGHDDDLRVPTSVLSGIDRSCSCNKHGENQERFPELNLSYSMQLRSANEISVGPKSKRYQSRLLADTSSNLSTKMKNSKSLKRPHNSCNKENKISSVDILNGEVRANAWLHHESGRSLENASNVRNESCSRQSLGVDNGSLNALETRYKTHEEKNAGTTQVRGLNRHNKVPSTSMLESVYCLNMCPDDIVGIIGQKHFWKVRIAIIDQQRIFAMQVFELHRLIKVQRLIAASPKILLEDTYYMGKLSLDVSPFKKLGLIPNKKLPSDNVSEPPLIVKIRDRSQKPKIGIEYADENAVAKLPHPSANGDTHKGLLTQRPKYEPYSANVLSTSRATNTGSSSPWGFSPPGSQWLVPVMSPSEGLVYKPYAGPCPPTAGILAPVYGSCGPLNLATGGGDFLSSTYGVSASYQQGFGILPGTPPIGQTYFPHYGTPVRNPSVSGSVVEQVSPFTGVKSMGNRLSTGDVNFTIAQQSSCNISSQMSQAISFCVTKIPASKESEIQASTASSPSERTKGDALPLFPTKPTTQACTHKADTSGQQTRVIKVVPHNRKLATESAARTFQSIQEERKQLD
ncbi:hypothetical protein E1A91_A05G141500v1 [Gossypium mustelinum]|uniref:Protein EARLY FLOWERING 3 n=1 Tax=Gossypium mustelinum TaxID=34275 RepID=A0A5D2Z727_GOSMU|nr:hypothetical protein E1A91_A05G141500v1 [Gossypium mustelinum]